MKSTYGSRACYAVRGKQYRAEDIRQELHIEQRDRIVCLLNADLTPKILGLETPLNKQELKLLFAVFYASIPRNRFLKKWAEFKSLPIDLSDVMEDPRHRFFQRKVIVRRAAHGHV